MKKCFLLSLLFSLIVMSSLTVVTKKGSITEDYPNLSPIYTISYTSRGLPFRYLTVYSNPAGTANASNPVNTGVHYKIVALDFVCWWFLFFIIAGLPYYIASRHKQASLETRRRHYAVPPH